MQDTEQLPNYIPPLRLSHKPNDPCSKDVFPYRFGMPSMLALIPVMPFSVAVLRDDCWLTASWEVTGNICVKKRAIRR